MTWHTLGERARRLPAPPHIVRADLAAARTDGLRAWLDLARDEQAPQVVDGTAGELIWSGLWPGEPRVRVRFTVESAGSDTQLRFVIESPTPIEDPSRIGHYRRRINELLWRDLRASYGQ